MKEEKTGRFEHEKPPVPGMGYQEPEWVERRIKIHPFLDEWLNQDHINANKLIDRLVRIYEFEHHYFTKIAPDQNTTSKPEVYGEGWDKKKKKAVRERDGKVCQNPTCGISQKKSIEKYNQKLNVHHLIKAKDIENPQARNAMENLVTLCKKCHYRWEKMSSAGIKPQLDP